MNRITGHVAYPAGKVKPRLALMTPPGPPGDLLRLLAQAAEDGAMCPSGKDIANKLNLPDERSAMRMMRKLEDAGWITLDTSVGRVTVVTIRDTGKSTRSPAPPEQSTPRAGSNMLAKEDATLRLIARAASMGDRCPTNREIAAYLRLNSESAASKVVEHLKASGQIVVERFQHARVVTIVATGASTARPDKEVPHWREAAGGAQ